MNVSIMVMRDASALLQIVIEEDQGFQMHHSTLTEITKI